MNNKIKPEMQKRDAENRKCDNELKAIIQTEYTMVNKSLTEHLELYKKQWEEVTPISKVQYTYDTHKPSGKPDTAQQYTVTNCQGDIQTNTPLLNQQKTELE